MKIRSHLLRLLLLASIGLSASLWVTAETNSPIESQVSAPAVNPEFTEIREKLEAVQRAHIETAEKWDALMKQNSNLSNVLGGLQQTLSTQREREIEIEKASNSLHLKVMLGAAAAVLLVIILSYWFQMRCFNRVMELSRALPALPPPPSPALLEKEGASSSKLLGAMKVLEHRIQQLEHQPGHSSNGLSPETIPAQEQPAISAAGPSMFTDTVDTGNLSSKVGLLVAKGQVLLDTERLPEAVNCFSEALALDPSNAEAYLKKGIALERMNRLEQSLSAYEEALRLNPKRAVAYVYKARVLAGLHRYDEALSVYDSALGKNTVNTGSTTVTT